MENDTKLLNLEALNIDSLFGKLLAELVDLLL